MNKVTVVELQDRLGYVVLFKTNSKVNLTNKFSLTYKSKPHYFEVVSVKSDIDNALCVKAKEIGYWCNYFKMIKDFDIRDIVGSDITMVTSEVELKRISAESCYL